MLKVLSGLLQKHGIAKTTLAAQVQQANKKPLSQATISLLINKGLYPKTTPQTDIQRQIVDFLKSKDINVPKNLFVEETSADVNPEETTYEVNEMLSQDAKKVFKLFQNPFQSDVNEPKDVFWSPEQLYIREAMRQTAKFGGFMAIIGESGAGKSTLLKHLTMSCKAEKKPIVFILPKARGKNRLTDKALCDSIIRKVSIETTKRDIESSLEQLERVLIESAKCGTRHCLVLEEAHNLNINTFKFLKQLWEMEYEDEKLLSILLIGQPEFKGMLTPRQNWEAREVINRCVVAELLPLDDKIESYLALKFSRIQRKYEDFFSSDAGDAIRKKLAIHHKNQSISMSYPLTINNLVVRCLNLAADLGVTTINADIVKQA